MRDGQSSRAVLQAVRVSSGSESQITPSKSSATTSEDMINVLVRCLAALWIVRGHDDQPADSESMPGAAAETKRDIETKTKDVCLCMVDIMRSQSNFRSSQTYLVEDLS